MRAARPIAQQLNEMWGQPVIIDNRPGAGTTMGTELVARATPDGYTLLLTNGSIGTMPGLYRKLSFDPLKDARADRRCRSPRRTCSRYTRA